MKRGEIWWAALKPPAGRREVRGVAADAMADWAKNDAGIQRAVDAFRTWEAQNPQPAQELPEVNRPQ